MNTPRKRGRRVDHDASRPSQRDLRSTDPQTAALAWYALSRHTLKTSAPRTSRALLRANSLVSKTDNTGLYNDIHRALVFHASDFAHCRPDARKQVELFTQAVKGLRRNVVRLLKDPNLTKDPLGTTLILVEYGEIIVPYVQMTLATRRKPLSAAKGMREKLLAHLRHVERLLASNLQNSAAAWDTPEAEETLHARYFGLLSQLRGLLRLIADPLSWH